jgi:CHAT domain-containing protein
MNVPAQSAARGAGIKEPIPQSSFLISQADTALQLAIQGKELYEAGQFEEAARSWQRAAEVYTQQGNEQGRTESLMNKAEALQALGLYPRACNTLLQAFRIAESDCQPFTRGYPEYRARQDFLLETLSAQPNSPSKVVGLRKFGDVFLKMGELELSGEVLQLIRKVPQEWLSPQVLSAIAISLGNVERAKGDRKAQQDASTEPKPAPLRCTDRQPGLEEDFYLRAAQYYREAVTASTSPIAKVRAQLNQLSVLLKTRQQSEAKTLWFPILSEIDNLPLSRVSVEARINLARSLTCLITLESAPTEDVPSWQEIDRILISAAEQAKRLDDRRLVAYALGYRGGLYEQIQPLSLERNPDRSRETTQQAIRLTQQALMLAQSIQASDIAYLWQWQLGHLLKTQGDLKGAVTAYAEAFNTIELLRSDLIALNPDIEFSFRESVEPVYRQLVDLLLQPELSRDDVRDVVLNRSLPHSWEQDAETLTATAPKSPLELAREVIESFQVAELENFLRCSLQKATLAEIDKQVDPTAAVIYPIVLHDRIEVLLRLPGESLQRYSNPLPDGEKIEVIIENLSNALQANSPISPQDVETLSKPVYDLLLGDRFEAQIQQNDRVKTLVFVLDSSLRAIPVAALYDGQQYLIQRYAIALSPSLRLLGPKPLERGRLEALVAGLSEGREGFSPLPAVEEEVEQVTEVVSGRKLLNEEFNREALKDTINSRPFPIVHLATHSQFSSQLENTFILAGDGKIKVDQLRNLLQTRERTLPEPIELLVLSACETAKGDKRAALGLAGMSIRSGARSTLATLWQVRDGSTATVMTQFYQQLVNDPNITKAEALRRAQIERLEAGEPPSTWAPYVLIGNWL